MLIYNNNTPILFLIFNRPDITQQVFDAIRKVKPLRLYIAADGPRNEKEKINCDKTRNIINQIDWKCELKTLFREKNLGCRSAVSSAITWFFENEEEGIILEDDCLPSESFFGFCSYMLEYYRYDDRIGHIAGSNFQQGYKRGDGSYYFSNLTHVWGWAGWRRVWEDYDVDLSLFPQFVVSDVIDSIGSHNPHKEYWIHCLKETYKGNISSWAYQYAFLNLAKGRLSVMPNVNLISNIGFGVEATHTTEEGHPFGNLKRNEIEFVKHPEFYQADIEADLFTQKLEYNIADTPSRKKGLLSRAWKRIKEEIK